MDDWHDWFSLNISQIEQSFLLSTIWLSVLVLISKMHSYCVLCARSHIEMKYAAMRFSVTISVAPSLRSSFLGSLLNFEIHLHTCTRKTQCIFSKHLFWSSSSRKILSSTTASTGPAWAVPVHNGTLLCRCRSWARQRSGMPASPLRPRIPKGFKTESCCRPLSPPCRSPTHEP